MINMSVIKFVVSYILDAGTTYTPGKTLKHKELILCHSCKGYIPPLCVRSLRPLITSLAVRKIREVNIFPS